MTKRRMTLALFTTLFFPFAAFAHSHLKASDPKQDSTVEKAPNAIALTFSGPLEPTMSKIEVKDASGHAVDIGPVIADADDPRKIHAPLKDPRSLKGTYEVTWKAVSKDTHSMRGTYKFSVAPKGK